MLQLIHTPASSNISRYGWNGTNLYIEFQKTRQVYEYRNVPEATFEEMYQASSVGSFFHAFIKKGFECRELPMAEARALGFEAITEEA